MRMFSVAAAAFLLLPWGCSSRDECDAVKREAQSLVSELASCRAGERCRVVDLTELAPNSCLGALQCSVALREGIDLGELARRAAALEARFSRCGECVMAGCRDPAELEAICNAASGRCEIRERDGLR